MPTLQFTRRACIIGGQTAPNDWSVYVNGKKIGRFLFYNKGPIETHRWTWNLGTYPTRSGQAETLQQALAQIKDTVPPLAIDGTVQMSGQTTHRSFKI